MVDSDHNWRMWGERDPYYAVLADPRFRNGHIDAHREAFFASGEIFVTHWLATFERHFGPSQRARALDFGCGVGRLTIPLAGHFDQVVGLDIAPAMLAEARRNGGPGNIDYVLSDDALSRLAGTFDFVNSCIVLQHIPVRRGMALLARLLDHVRPGGGCLIQLSTRRNYSWWRNLRYHIRHNMPGGQALMNRLAGKAADTPVMQMNEYPLDDVLRLFSRAGFDDLLLRYEDHGGIDTTTIMARRTDRAAAP